ncbi:DUF992 domain-containing protein [Bosea sp. BH3]|uniref:DUF992 domain-containing protein n=1 Tax=Bosea sp. BH3 TaxID=2871701 RepID=UPI0021CB904E|nr:DUF992 domain-containing protein [Bosea sp. BH3]MCU4181396.1 DUF992 domain-containing protein [Bosea sp. BH3]
MKIGRPRLVTAMALLGLLGLPSAAEAQTDGPSAGRLSCTVGGALTPITTAQKPMECRFRPRRGPIQHYTGIVQGFGLDLGSIRNPIMAWRVHGPYARASLGALAGSYKGAPAGGGNLTGGADNAVTLRPAPFQSNRGVNAAVGVNALELTLIPPSRRR